jgi:hypothetical protein
VQVNAYVICLTLVVHERNKIHDYLFLCVETSSSSAFRFVPLFIKPNATFVRSKPVTGDALPLIELSLATREKLDFIMNGVGEPLFAVGGALITALDDDPGVPLLEAKTGIEVKPVISTTGAGALAAFFFAFLSFFSLDNAEPSR